MNNDATMKEKADVLRNDLRNQGSTFSQFAESDAATSLGRFNAISAPHVVGTQQVPKYPAGPDWTRDPVPDEMRLGLDVNALEPTGEPFEVQRSLSVGPASLHSQAPTPSVPDTPLAGAEPGDPTVVPPPGAVGSPIFRRA